VRSLVNIYSYLPSELNNIREGLGYGGEMANGNDSLEAGDASAVLSEGESFDESRTLQQGGELR
jgi:hypothetical protein